jgi:CheY-like chemotaxis protein
LIGSVPSRKKHHLWKKLPKFIHLRKEGSFRKWVHRKAGGQITVPNILIVDGHAGVQELLREEFVSEGCRVVATGDPDYLRALIQSFRPHLVVLDPFLNGKNRWDLLAFLKSSYPRLPVLIVTAYAESNDEPCFSEADGCVIKSSTCFAEVKKKAGAILRRRPSRFRMSEGARYFSGFGAVPRPRLGTAG